MNRVLLLLAQGLGTGRIPVAPGTVGSLLGLAWFAVILWPGDLFWFAAAVFGGCAAAVPLCGRAELELREKDPASVVLDEIVAMPICFLGWLFVYATKHQSLPAPEYFFRKETCLITTATFGLFRLFDIWKPWPVRQSQALAGGWGVTADDVLAAVYTALIMGPVAAWWGT